jgi:uncharacterized protein (DUF952 family)
MEGVNQDRDQKRRDDDELDDVPPPPTVVAGVADPTNVNPPMVSGGLGDTRTNDGTQVVRDFPGAVPGKPQAPIPGGGGSLSGGGVDPLEGQAMDRGAGAGLDPVAAVEGSAADPAAGPVSSPAGGEPTLHLSPEEVWRRQEGRATYEPEAYAADGFIHCTLGEGNLLSVANAFYKADPRPHLVLVLDPARIGAEVRFEDEGRIYPHIYGPLNTDAVVAVRRAIRAADGTFVGVE